jgi:Transposase IS116/IS110/IS902 family
VSREIITGCLAAIDGLAPLIERLDAELHQRARAGSRVKVLTTLPGVGEFTALVILARIGAITRFGSARKLASWAGLTPTVRGSDQTVRHGHILKQGSAWLRWVLNLAAQTAKRSPEFSATYAAISKRRGKKTATIAISRKLLTRAYHLLASAQEHPATPRHARPAPRIRPATAAKPRARSQLQHEPAPLRSVCYAVHPTRRLLSCSKKSSDLGGAEEIRTPDLLLPGGSTSTRVHLCRSPSSRVPARPPPSACVAILPCCTHSGLPARPVTHGSEHPIPEGQQQIMCWPNRITHVALDTDPETADTAFASAEKLSKHPNKAKGRPGFIVNFADATYHHQWIHVEPERAAKSPYGARSRTLPDVVVLSGVSRRRSQDRRGDGRRPQGSLPGTSAGKQQDTQAREAGIGQPEADRPRVRVRVLVKVEGPDRPDCVIETVVIYR